MPSHRRYLAGHLVVMAITSLGLYPTQPARAETEFEARAAIDQATQRSFENNDFAELEKVAGAYRKSKSRTASGLWRLTVFYGGLDKAIKSYAKGKDRDVAYEALEDKTKKWVEAFPDSPTGHIAQSMVLIDRAWAHRGGGYAYTVTEEGWAGFFEYVAATRANLEKYKDVAAVDPNWYHVMLIVAKAQQWDRAEFDKLFSEALDREPLYYQTYFSALEFLLPKWGGNMEEIEDFAQDAVRRTSEQEGRGMYARIYWYASQAQFKNDLFNVSLADWPQMKAGFEDVIARFPDAWNLNNYARFACLARDKPKTQELLKRIDTSVIADAWVPLLLKGECAFWASQP